MTAAMVWFERRLVLAAGIAFLAATIPHFIRGLGHPAAAGDLEAASGAR